MNTLTLEEDTKTSDECSDHGLNHTLSYSWTSPGLYNFTVAAATVDSSIVSQIYQVNVYTALPEIVIGQ